MITAEILSKLTTRLNVEQLKAYASALDKICPLYGINTADIFHEFIANLLHESGEFRDLEEGLNYSSNALFQKFSRQRISATDCEKFGRTKLHKANQVEIANHIYGGEWGRINLGNTKPGDGWTFRGSGQIQNTGRRNITRFAEYYNKKFETNHSPEVMANLMRTDIDIGIHSACWFFAIAKNIIQLAIDDWMKTIVKKINGGYNGLPERMRYYELAKKYIV